MRGRRLSLRHSVKHYEASDPKSFMLRFICICSRVLFLLRSSDDVNSIALNIFKEIGIDVPMHANHIDRTLEQLLKEPLQTDKEIEARLHVNTNVHIAVFTLFTS